MLERLAAAGRWTISESFARGLPERLSQVGVPGISIALGDPREAPRTNVAGSLTPARERAVEPGTVFSVGSLSKPVLATIAIKLDASDVFELDRPLVEYLDTDVPTGDGAARITARHALQHTTGLRNWRFTLADELIVSREPGSAWGYSGEGIVLVQRALETVTGRGLEALAREYVFGPFGMPSTTFLWRSDLVDRSATPFVPASDRFVDYAVLARWKARALVEWAESSGDDPADVNFDDARAADDEISALAARLAGRTLPQTDPMPTFIGPNAAGGLQTTAADYLRFLQAWLADDSLRRAALTSSVPHPEGLSWGVGWGMMRPGEEAFWHWGEAPGVRTLAYADPGVGEGGEGIVILTNGELGMTLVEAAFVDATGFRSSLFDAL